MTSYTALKRRFTVGSRIRVENYRFPQRSGERTILTQQTNAIASGPCVNVRGEVIEKSWCYWPKASEVRVEGDSITMLGGPGPDGAAFTYTLLGAPESATHAGTGS